MSRSLIIALVTALAAGIAIGAQATLGNMSGRIVGPARTALLMNGLGGSVAATLILVWIVTQGREGWVVDNAIPLNLVAGILGIFIVGSVAFAVEGLGVTAGIATLFFGQMLVGMIVDTTGINGAEPIPISRERIIGLVIMAVALYFLLPREE